MNFIFLGIVAMIVLGIIAVFLYFESNQNTEKVKVKIPISEMTEIIKEPLHLNSTITKEVSPPITVKCFGNAKCITGKITKIIDGDTIKVGENSIRFALTSAPEINTLEGMIAKDFVESICPVGSTVLVDEDDKQTEGSYGRIIGVVYCNALNLNEQILESGNGKISKRFCDESEFSEERWAIKYGC